MNQPIITKNSIPSSKKFDIERLEIIKDKVKKDHLRYQSQLPLRKNLSSYTSAYPYQNSVKKEINDEERKRLEELKKRLPSEMLHNQGFNYRKSMHQSSIGLSRLKTTPFADFKIGSVYQQAYLERSIEKVDKGKQQDGYFIKVPWYDELLSNYKKSFQNPFQHQKTNSIDILKKHERNQSISLLPRSSSKHSFFEIPSNYIDDKNQSQGQSIPAHQSLFKKQSKKSKNKENLEPLKSIKKIGPTKSFKLPEIKKQNLESLSILKKEKTIKKKVVLNSLL